MADKIYEWDEIETGDFIKVSWEEAKYKNNHWTIKPQFFVGKVFEKTFRHIDCEIYFPNEEEELGYKDVMDIAIKRGSVELVMRSKIVIPRVAFSHLIWSKKKRTAALIKDKEPIVYTKIQKLKASDVLIYEI